MDAALPSDLLALSIRAAVVTVIGVSYLLVLRFSRTRTIVASLTR